MVGREVLVERLGDQMRTSWLEFATISIGVNLVASVITFGYAVTADVEWRGRVVMLAIWTASSMATVLAYYSVVVGTVLVDEPVSLTQVALAVVVAGSQIAMFLLVTEVAANLDQYDSVESQVRRLRHWLAILASFAVLGGLTNGLGARIRSRSPSLADLGGGASTSIRVYERRQRSDRLGALGTAVSCLILWVSLLAWPNPWTLLIGALVASAGLLVALLSQQAATRDLWVGLRASTE